MTSLLRDTTGKRSSRRVVTVAASAAILLAFAVDVAADIEVDHALLSAVQTIALVGLGAVTADHFSPAAVRLRRKPTHQNPEP